MRRHTALTTNRHDRANNGTPAYPLRATSVPLASADRHHLASHADKIALVRDRVSSVVHRYYTGFYLHGIGGIGKSYTVLAELNRLRANFRLWNSQMTARGLFEALAAHPDVVHVMEDMEQVTGDRRAQGVLRSALWAQKQETDGGLPDRLITWATNRGEERVLFSGGIIMLANRPLDDLPELRAVATRIACVEYRPTEVETQAVMRSVARKGYSLGQRSLTPADCSAVTEYLIEQALALRRPLDMRLMVHAFHDRLQWEESDSSLHWRDLVAATVRGHTGVLREPVAHGGRAEQRRRDLEIAREIEAATTDRAERARSWQQRTGKSEKTLYRRLAEIRRA